MTPGQDVDPSSPAFFDELYRRSSDPWNFSDDPYEQHRYRCTLEHVPAGRYATAYEPGCSVGVLTEALAGRCSRVLAVDISAEAVRRARARCVDLPAVDIRLGALADGLPEGPVDLIVLSEVGYYLDPGALAPAVSRLVDGITPGGRLVAVHWLGHSPDHRLHGRDVHDVLARTLADHPAGPMLVVAEEHPHAERHGFLLAVWDVPDDRSAPGGGALRRPEEAT